jgi:putative transposase
LRFGLETSECTVSRDLRYLSPGDQARRPWVASLGHHRDVIMAKDFFTVPTLTFQVLYGFLVIEHGRRRIVHFNVTDHPTGPWIVRLLREAFPDSCAHRYMINRQLPRRRR